MKKLLALMAVLGLFAFVAMPAVAKVEREPAWELTAPQDITFTCGGYRYHELLEVTNLADGDFEGKGWYKTNHSYTWDIDGNIDGDTIEFHLVYTGSNAGYTLNGDGTIASDGSIIGTTDGNCTAFAMGAGTATLFEGNHGQWVKSQEDKQAAAQSRIGMPTQSNGHVVEE